MELRRICQENDNIPFDHHKHRCDSCNIVWEHSDDVPGETTLEQFEFAHSCPTCNRAQRMKFFPDGKGPSFQVFLQLLEKLANEEVQ